MRLHMYRAQVVIRETEQRISDLFLENLAKGASHLSLGQEVVAAGSRVICPSAPIAATPLRLPRRRSEITFDLFLGVPKHRVPNVVLDSGLAENGWVAVNPRTLEIKYPGVYAVGGRRKHGNAQSRRNRRRGGESRCECIDRKD
jgi:hypothetical protein